MVASFGSDLWFCRLAGFVPEIHDDQIIENGLVDEPIFEAFKLNFTGRIHAKKPPALFYETIIMQGQKKVNYLSVKSLFLTSFGFLIIL